jgi:hypothetical protein
MSWLLAGLAAAAAGAATATAAAAARHRGLHRWLPSYLLTGSRRCPVRHDEPVHLLLCVADHYEPLHGRVSPQQGAGRVERWREEYPRFCAGLRDSDGRPPRHTFFFPPEEYKPEYMEGLVALCRAGLGEVEVHVHHDNDTEENLRRLLTEYRELLTSRHGLLGRRRVGGAAAYGFIHGNWALCNSRPDGRWCGVNGELEVLRDTGCYADFTLPSAPNPTQTRKVNSIYYASGNPRKPRAHDGGIDVGAGPRPEGGLLMVQGPLLLDWGRRKWGVFPKLENACLQANQQPTARRLDLWLRARIQVPTRPDWFFVKVHTHGAKESNADFLLGPPMRDFHEALRKRAEEHPNFHYHYVTAREMYNLARAAEANWDGDVASALDYELVAPPAAQPGG